MTDAQTGDGRLVIADDDGWFVARVKAADGTETDIQLDALQSHNIYAGLCQQHEDETARADAWGRWLMDHGVPALSHAGAWMIASAIIGQVRGWYPPAPTPAAPAPAV